MTIIQSPSVQSSLREKRLSHQLTVIIGLIFAIGMIISGIFITFIVNQKAQQEVSAKATMLMETMDSVRDYTSENIAPKLSNLNSKEFLPEVVPAFSAHAVFENLRKNPQYQEFIYREAALNPTNINDKADLFEAEIIEQFRQDYKLKEKTGFLSSTPRINNNVFYIARPLAVNQRSCLECHSTPSRAPKKMVDKYGKQNGFNWRFNEIIGAQIVFIPAEKVLSNAQQLFMPIALVTLIIFGVAVAILHRWLQQKIIQPITKIAYMMESISMGYVDQKLDSERQDEIGILSRSINRMVISLQMAIARINNPKR
jgi:HAMP domain-containing protein